MRRPLVLLTIAVSLSAGILLRAEDDLVASRFGDYLEALRAQAGIPGMAATLIRAGEPNWERAFGRQDIDRAIATRADTPFELDGTTQLITAGIILRCVEDGRLSLDDRVGKFAAPDALPPEPNATIRQILSHTTATDSGLVFSYQPERLDALAAAIVACRKGSFQHAFVDLLERFAMVDSVPGSDIVSVSTPRPPDISSATLQRFRAVLNRLSTPYAIGASGNATISQYVATTLTPASGLISTVRDLAQFDAALKKGVLVRPETLALAWTPAVDGQGQLLPHGLGWFVQSYNGERVVWQFGVSDDASSSLVITIPRRGITLILLANSQGLVRPFPLAAGDAAVSPFARVFLSFFVR
jgi:CubicO group peptidase (beta-lactamase class C family)